MLSAKEIRNAFLHLVFPHVCAGCGRDLDARSSLLCIRCIHDLPETGFAGIPDNPVEKIFWGRIPVQAAMAGYYFSKTSLIQSIIHQVKYRGAKELGILMGRYLGEQLLQSERFYADVLVPLPLFQKRERARGYNQAEIIAMGISEATRLPLVSAAVTRPEFTETQTRKGRVERWMNIEGKFLVTRPAALEGRHVLLVDDVITTGATLESCGSALLHLPGLQLSLAALCYASR